MHVEQVEHRDAPGVMQIITLSLQHMRAQGIQQWDEIYQNLQVIEDDARAFVFSVGPAFRFTKRLFRAALCS